eukprot:CAMPEP_0117446694 /NCGR_PEP_ID=MMETSP0759-20121206/6481_1 /TAXON_ID=63605 /ORGANISM="Percolomonas cosmopolitus, Strain WS" /LENGTH=115 /DNA_ID=CAMNT_0005238985 /DNA_START=681 /DNA_END=1026 /DNA_ORIENTATION=+
MQEKECDDAMEETHDGPGSPIRGAHHELHGDEDDNQQKQIENEKLALLEPSVLGFVSIWGIESLRYIFLDRVEARENMRIWVWVVGGDVDGEPVERSNVEGELRGFVEEQQVMVC